MIRDLNLPVLFARLDKMGAELERARRDKTAYRPAITEIPPETEMRSISMRHKLSYAQALEAELEKLSAESNKIEIEVEAANLRAKKVRATVQAHMQKLKKASDTAVTLLETLDTSSSATGTTAAAAESGGAQESKSTDKGKEG